MLREHAVLQCRRLIYDVKSCTKVTQVILSANMNNTTTTKLGRSKLCHNGFSYTFERRNAEESLKFWRCDQCAATACRARLHSNNDNIAVQLLGEHNHDSSAAKVSLLAWCFY